MDSIWKSHFNRISKPDVPFLTMVFTKGLFTVNLEVQ